MNEETKKSIIRDTLKLEGDYFSNERVIQNILDSGFDPKSSPIIEGIRPKVTDIFGFKK